MKVVGVIQARMGSTRLPGKIMESIVDGRPLLEVQTSRACIPDMDWWLATTAQSDDDITAEWALRAGMDVYRGDVDDVLSRFLEVASITGADWLVRLTGDNPFTEARMVQCLVEAAIDAPPDVDLIRDPAGDRWFPMGFIPEVVRVSRLRVISASKGLPTFHRAHVTSAIPASRVRPIDHRGMPAHPELRWTIDTWLDLKMARELTASLTVPWQWATYDDLLSCIQRHPEIASINADVSQKAVEEG